METVTDFILEGSKITEDGACSHEFKRHLLLGRKAMTNLVQFNSVNSVVSNSLRPHELQHARPPCPSPIPGVHPNPCPLAGDANGNANLIHCHPLLLLPSILPSISVFSNESVLCIRWQSIGALASASILPMNIQD